MEDGTAVDLDWFWKGWFFTTDNVDIELSDVKWFRMREDEVTVENKVKKGQAIPVSGTTDGEDRVDFSQGPKPFTMIPTADGNYGQYLSRLDEGEVRDQLSGKNIYELTFKNKGGLVMPVIIEWSFADGSKEIEKLPAEIWRHNEAEVSRTFLKDKEVVKITIDPNHEVADVDLRNNSFPKTEDPSKFDEFKKADY